MRVSNSLQALDRSALRAATCSRHPAGSRGQAAGRRLNVKL